MVPARTGRTLRAVFTSLSDETNLGLAPTHLTMHPFSWSSFARKAAIASAATSPSAGWRSGASRAARAVRSPPTGRDRTSRRRRTRPRARTRAPPEPPVQEKTAAPHGAAARARRPATDCPSASTLLARFAAKPRMFHPPGLHLLQRSIYPVGGVDVSEYRVTLRRQAPQ